MKKRLALMMALTVTAASLLAGCGGSSDGSSDAGSDSQDTSTAEFTEKAEGDTFTVGFDQDFPPMGFVGEDGEYTGFDLELAQAVCDKMGWEFVPEPIAWDAKDAMLESGAIDCIWNGFTINGREDDYTWSDPYLDNSQAALEDNQELSSTFGNLQVIADYNTGFMELESGVVDAVAMDIVVASYQIESRDADFVILDDVISTEEYGVGFAKGNEAVRDQVQTALEELAADGTMAEISTKWFGEDITTIGK